MSVTDFGARGDGTTDDTQAVLQAVEFVKSQGARGRPQLVFPSGSFVLSAPLLIDSFVAEGAGPHST